MSDLREKMKKWAAVLGDEAPQEIPESFAEKKVSDLPPANPDFASFVFPIIRREPIPDPYAGEQCCYEPGICMRLGCGEARWTDPEKGETVLCEDHAREVYEKRAKGPLLIPTFIPPLPESLRSPRGGVFFMDYTNVPEEPEKS